MYELGGAKQAGSTYAHGGPAGKRGKSLREGRKNPRLPLCAVLIHCSAYTAYCCNQDRTCRVCDQ